MLLPVTWVDGWPIIGIDQDGDGLGEMVWQYRKPVLGQVPLLPQTSDEFDCEVLAPQWQWNHQDRKDSWSLCARPGFMRLTACKPVYPGGFYRAANTLTQRLMGESGVVTLRLELSGLANGQYAGICLLSDPSLLLGIYAENGKRMLRRQYTRWTQIPDPHSRAYDDSFFCEDFMTWEQNEIYLRLIHTEDRAQLAYSADGVIFSLVGEPEPFTFFAWRGGRVGLFTYNEFSDGGYADFDWMHYEINTSI